MKRFIQHGSFILFNRYGTNVVSSLRKIRYRLLGMQVGAYTVLPKLYVTWPHQVRIGKFCTIEHNVYFKFDGIWKPGPSILISDRVFIGSGCEFNITQTISIGQDSLIGSGCRFIDHDHVAKLNRLIRFQGAVEKSIVIGNDVWLGCNVVILKGVEIGDGAVVAAGAVVTKSIPSNEIWAGVPARKISERC